VDVQKAQDRRTIKLAVSLSSASFLAQSFIILQVAGS